jgi:RNA polymerase sigma-70 factor (ECF subfamily)
MGTIAHRDRIEQWVRKYQARIRAFLYTRTGSESRSDDLAQEVFLVVVRRIEDFDLSQDPFPWLMGIAKNMLRQHWKANVRSGRMDPLEEVIAETLMQRDEEAIPDETETRLRLLKECRNRLADKARSIVQMIYFEGLSCVEVARRLGKDVNAVRTAIHRVRLRLRECMEAGLRRAQE